MPFAPIDPRITERLCMMERRIAALEHALRTAVAPSDAAATSAPTTGTAEPAAEPIEPRSVAGRSPARGPAAVPGMQSEADARSRAEMGGFAATVPAMPAYGKPRRDDVATTKPEPDIIWRWFMGGNALARVGVVVLFIGVAFLVKYASEHVTIPIEVRLAAVAAGGIVLLAIGWRLRQERAGYAMILQGAGIAILYLTVFASLRLYQLMPEVAAFGFLVWIAVVSAFLAIRQDTVALAVIGVVGGFAAPVLTSNGAGSHVMLFSYYAVLNAAILGIAWFKAWRVLNVVGFACTFVVGTLFGVTRYRPEDFATTEPFLVLFFLFYVAIVTLYARHRSLELKRYVDATLVFGTPLVSAALQATLVRHIEYAMAWSAIAASAIYLTLARALYARHRDELRLLVESFLALAVVFGTLAVPLALDARVTSATWALEGAALVWIGTRQARLGSRLFGLLLQIAAGTAFALEFSGWTQRLAGGHWPILNADCIGAVLIAAGGLLSARELARPGAINATERSLVPIVFGWGVAWWLGAGWREIERFVAIDAHVTALVAFLAASAVAFAALATRLGWTMARVPALSLPVALLLIALFRMADMVPVDGHLLAGWGSFVWPCALAVHLLLLRHFEHISPPVPENVLDVGHAIFAWLFTLIAAHELAWFASSSTGGAAWPLVPWGVVPALMLSAITTFTLRAGWPLGTHVRAYRRIAAVPIVAAMLAYTLYANAISAGDPAPLPFIPFLNPLDLAQGFVVVAIAFWLRRARDVDQWMLPNIAPNVVGIIAAVLLYWLTCSTLRTLHYWADIPWSFSALWASRIVQSTLSIVWSLFALAAMVIANRRSYRSAWAAGAILLAIVVVKLFLVDLAQVGGVERIVSFMSVGVLLLIIGYVAPVPPRSAMQ
jgi:uncharacterized membrane protein